MNMRWMKRLRRASRSARSAVLQKALAPAFLFVLSAFYCWAVLNSLDAGSLGHYHGRLHFMDAIVHSPHLIYADPSTWHLLSCSAVSLFCC